MNTDNGSLSFDIKLELDRLRNDVEKAKEQLRSIGKTAKAEGDNMDNALLKVGKTMGAVFAANQVKAFISQVVSLRSEIQRLEISFETLAGKSKGNALFSEIRQFAVQTPMMMRDLAQGAQTMLAFNIEAGKVMPILKALGDISMGDAQRFNSLALAFSQMSATGRLMGQDLLQMINAGFNPLAQISEKSGKSIGTLKEEMEAGQISVEMVTQAFMDATAEGGKFHGMLEAQAEGIAGAQAKLAGAIDDMMNEIGESMEGTVVSLYDAATKLAQNYQQVGRVLSGLIATYGTYRAALIAVTAAKGWATAAEAAHYNWLLLVEKAQKLLNATMLANPYVLVATLIAGVVAAMVSMKTEAEKLREKEREYEEQKQKVIEAEQEHREEMDKLCDVAGDEAVATDTRREALYQLEKKYPDIFAKYDTEISKLENIKKIKQEIAELDGKKSITNTSNELSNVNKRIAELEAKKKTEHEEWDDELSLRPKKVKKGGLSADEDRELKVLYDKKKSLGEKKRKEDADAYFTNLTGISDEELEQRIKNRKNLIAKIDTSGGKYNSGKITSESSTLNGTYSRAELQAQLQMLERQKASRASAKTPAEFAKENKKAYDDAAKAYNDFLKKKDKMTPEEFAKESKALKDARDAAKKKYDSYAKPYQDSDEKSAANKADQERKRSNRKKVEAAERERAIEEAKQAEIKANCDAALEVRQEELNLQSESTEKRLAQIEIDKERMANAIADREAELLKRYRAMKKHEWENANPDYKDEGKIFDYKSITLDTMRTDASGEGMDWLADALKAIEESKRIMAETTKKATDDTYADEKKALNEYLRQYGTLTEKRKAIIDIAASQIKGAATEGEKKAIGRRAADEVVALDAGALKMAEPVRDAFGDIGSLSKEAVRTLIANMQTARKEFVALADPLALQEFEKALSQLQQADIDLSLEGGIDDLVPKLSKVLMLHRQINDEISAYAALEEQQRKLKAEYDELTMTTDPDTGEQTERILSEEETVRVEALKLQLANIALMLKQSATRAKDLNHQLKTAARLKFADFTKLGKGISLATRNVALFAQTFNADVAEALNKSAEAIGGMAEAVDTIQKSFKTLTDSTKKIVEDTVDGAEKLVEGSGEAMKTSVTVTSQSLSTLEKASAILAIIGAAIQLATIVANLFNKDSKKEKEIERLQRKIDTLQESYAALDRSIAKAYSRDVSPLIEQQNAMLRQQQALIKQQLVLEQSKKSTDDERVANLQKQIRDIDNTIADNKEKMVDAIFGEDVKSAINSFADAYASMFDEGMGKAKSSKDLVRDMIKKMVMEALKTDLSAPMAKVREMLNGYFTDGVISDSQQAAVENYVEGVLADEQAKWGWADKYFKEDDSRTGSSRGLQSMTQDSPDELNARFTTIQGHVATINESLRDVAEQHGQIAAHTKELRDLQATAIEYLTAIANNTAELYGVNQRLERIEAYAKTTRNHLTDISTKGIRIKN